MEGRVVRAALFVLTLTLSEPSFAAAQGTTININTGSLSAGLQTLQLQTGIELLFDNALVVGLQAPEVRGDLTAEAALQQLLANTQLTARRARSGAWIVERPDTVPLAQQDAALPEVLIVGRRTQNADIRRIENDVQPYKVVTQSQILGADRDNIDQYFTSRVTFNTQVLPSDRSQDANTLSAINLRGLGEGDTLVLVDGRRMPRVPTASIGFTQSDLNPVPLAAIKRIEVLTGSAGGIYGFGALGGVVNVVLDRDTRGIDFRLTEGLSSRGDGWRQGFQGTFGHTSSDGATDIMLSGAHSRTDTPLVGNRGYALRNRRRTLELTPEEFQSHYPHGNSLTVQGVSGSTNLVFRPEFGGGSLNSSQTYLPTGFSGDSAALAAALTQHAGQEDLSITDSESRTDLGSNPRSDALLANLRHRFGAGLEAYVDALALRSQGDSNGDLQQLQITRGRATLSADSPANPFTDDITVDYPIDHLDNPVRKRVQTTRYTAGLIADLPLEWRGAAELSWGQFRRDASASIDSNIPALSLDLLGDPSDLDMNPLGDWSAFESAIADGRERSTLSDKLHSRFRVQSLRLAGPLFTAGDGPATLTLLTEHRTETVPTHTLTSISESEGSTTVYTSPVARQSTSTTSMYAEVRAPVFSQDISVPFLRSLELQLAVRHDKEEDDFSNDPSDPEADFSQARFTSTAFTVGAKTSPTPWLMLRASYATGEQPPPLKFLAESDPIPTTIPFATDPRRGGTMLGDDGEYLLMLGGNAALRTARADTLFLGTVLTPAGADGPRFAVDYSRIHRTRDIALYAGQDIMDHEDAWPERVVRAPLSDADRALGYTAGVVTLFNLQYANSGSLEVEALDLRADWPLRLFTGRMRFYADATYHLRNVQKERFHPDIHWAGYRTGPLKWRANGGFDWSTERLTLGANVQYFDSYLFTDDSDFDTANDFAVLLQGSRRIPSQTYVDLHGTWRLPRVDFGPVADLTIDFGIVNLLDTTPPRESSIVTMGPGYSRYGDPRQRRFELGVSIRL